MDPDAILESASLLDATATMAATAYYDNAVKYGVNKYPAGGVRKSRSWKKFVQVARICLANKIPVDKFVSAAFASAIGRHSVVTAQDICSYDPKNVLRGEDAATRESSPGDLWNLLSCKLLDMVFSLDGEQDKVAILDSTLYGFPAWFRLFALEKAPERIIVHWGDLADEEITDDPKLGEFLKAKRPATYKLLKSVMENI